MVRLCRFLSCLAAFIALPAPAEIPVSGRVVDTNGQGLPGVRVGFERIVDGYEALERWLDGEVGPGAEAETTTDAEGYYEILAPSMGNWRVVIPWGNDAQVTSQPPDYIARSFRLPLVRVSELPSVTLSPASVLEIKVLDHEGAPVDAQLSLSDLRHGEGGWHTRWRLARTGAEGLARMPWDPDEQPQLEVLGSSHPLVILKDDEFVVSEDNLIEVRLSPTGLTGIVHAVDSEGRDVAGALIYQRLPFGRTGEDGRLSLVVGPPESESPRIRVLTRDGDTGYLEPRFVPDETNEVTIRLERPRRIRGRVVDEESGRPVAGALVWIPKVRPAVTDADGTYEVSHSSSSFLRVRSVAPGYGRAFRGKEIESDASEEGPTLELPPAVTVRGRVVDPEGRPIAGVDITTVPVDGFLPYQFDELRNGIPDTRSTRTGRFHLTGLPPSTKYLMRFHKEGFASADREIEALEPFADRSGLRIVLSEGVAGEGRVVDEQQAPVTGAEVRLVPLRPRSTMGSLYYEPKYEADAGDVVVQTNSRGRFLMAHLASGLYKLEVRAAGFAPASRSGLTIDTEPATADLGTVVLEPGARIDGSVRDPEGSPVADARIYITADPFLITRGEVEPLARSDAEGRFHLRDLQAGRHPLVVVKTGFGTEAVNVAAGKEGTVEIVLRPAGTLSGYVRDESGDPIARAFVSAGDSSGSCDEDGAFRIEGVGPGPVRLWVDYVGYQQYERGDLVVPPNSEVSDLEIVLVRGATITGTLTRADGTPVARTSVLSYQVPAGEGLTPGRFEAHDVTGKAGRFQLIDVRLGPTLIQAQLGENLTASKIVEVLTGTQSVELVFGESSEVMGRVRDEAGQPVAGAILTLIPQDGDDNLGLSNSEPVTSGPDGTFILTDVAAGLYRLAAAKEGYARSTTPEPFEVGREPSAVIDLELRRGATLSGRILGLEPGEAAQVFVQAQPVSGHGGIAEGVVDLEGRYSVPNLSSGPWIVVAALEDSGRSTFRQVSMEEGEIEIDLEFKSGHTVTGVVRSGGEPKSGAHVVALGLATGGQGIEDVGLAASETANDGRFRLSDLPAGKYLLVLTALSPRMWEIEVPTEEDVLIDLGAVRISGFVRDAASGRPLPGTALRLQPLDASHPLAGRELPTGVETDSRGYFSLDIEPGTWRIGATKAGRRFGPCDLPGRGPRRRTRCRSPPDGAGRNLGASCPGCGQRYGPDTDFRAGSRRRGPTARSGDFADRGHRAHGRTAGSEPGGFVQPPDPGPETAGTRPVDRTRRAASRQARQRPRGGSAVADVEWQKPDLPTPVGVLAVHDPTYRRP